MKKNTLTKTYHSLEEVLEDFEVENKIKGYAFNSKRTKDQIGNILHRKISGSSLRLLKELILIQNHKTGQLNITTKELGIRLDVKEKTAEMYLTALYKEIPEYLYIRYYWETPNRQRRQIFIFWDRLLEELPDKEEKTVIKSNPLVDQEVTTNEVSCLYCSSSGSSSVLNSGFKSSDKNSFNNEKIFDKHEKDPSTNQGINSFASLAIDSSQTSEENPQEELKMDKPSSVEFENKSSRKEEKESPKIEIEKIPSSEDLKDLQIKDNSTVEPPPPQCGYSVSTLDKPLFEDGNEFVRKSAIVPAKNMRIILNSFRSELERQEPKDYSVLLEDFKLERQKGFEPIEPVIKKEELARKEHYEKLERQAKLFIARREEIGKNKQQLREHRVRNIESFYSNYQEVLKREGCTLDEIKFRMRMNPLYEPFTQDTSGWNFNCHPEYANINEDLRDLKFIEAVDIWMWPKPYKHSARNIKMFLRARERADKLKITYYDWVAAIYDKIGELKIEYTHINCKFAEELIQKWQDEGSNYPSNFGHMRRQQWLSDHRKAGGKGRKRKTVDQESEEIRDYLAKFGRLTLVKNGDYG